MVAEFWNQQLLVFTCLLSASLLWDRNFSNCEPDHEGEDRGTQAPLFDGDLDDLESFQACREEIRTYMSQVNPSLYEVLGEIVFLIATHRRRGHSSNFSKNHEGET